MSEWSEIVANKDISPMTKLISSHIAHIDQGEDLEAIKTKMQLPAEPMDHMTTNIRCRHLQPEEASVFVVKTSISSFNHCKGPSTTRSKCLCSTCSHLDGEPIENTSLKISPSQESPAATTSINTNGFRKFHTLPWEQAPTASGLIGSTCESEGCITQGGGDVIDKKRYDSNDYYVGIIDSGASKHLLNRHLRLLNERRSPVWMTTANGQRTLLDREGDFELQTSDASGNPLDPLVLNDCSQLKGSSLNLLSVSVLRELGTTFHFEKKNSYFIFINLRRRMDST